MNLVAVGRQLGAYSNNTLWLAMIAVMIELKESNSGIPAEKKRKVKSGRELLQRQ